MKGGEGIMECRREEGKVREYGGKKKSKDSVFSERN